MKLLYIFRILQTKILRNLNVRCNTPTSMPHRAYYTADYRISMAELSAVLSNPLADQGGIAGARPL